MTGRSSKESAISSLERSRNATELLVKKQNVRYPSSRGTADIEHLGPGAEPEPLAVLFTTTLFRGSVRASIRSGQRSPQNRGGRPNYRSVEKRPSLTGAGRMSSCMLRRSTAREYRAWPTVNGSPMHVVEGRKGPEAAEIRLSDRKDQPQNAEAEPRAGDRAYGSRRERENSVRITSKDEPRPTRSSSGMTPWQPSSAEPYLSSDGVEA